MNWITERLKSLVKKLLSLSFLSWLGIFIYLIITEQKLDINFYILTAAVIGIKVIPKTLGGLREKGNTGHD